MARLSHTPSLSPMETVQERELQEWQRRAWWPLDTVACSSLDKGTRSSDGCRFLFEWDPQLCGCFGSLGVVGASAAAAGDPGDHRTTVEHELELFFPKCMESPASSESASPEDAAVIPEDPLDELLRNFWDADEQHQPCFSSSCILKEEERSADCSFLADDDLLAVTVSSGSPAEAPLPEETVAQTLTAEQLPPSSSSSSSPSRCTVEPQAGGAAQDQSKRSADDTTDAAWSGSKRSRTAASTVIRPFTVVRPGGADGVATLADINELVLTRPARPVRHPVGEFACAPRASSGVDSRPSPSGKTVTGFTRLHTAGRGTITIIRTTG